MQTEKVASINRRIVLAVPMNTQPVADTESRHTRRCQRMFFAG